MDMLRVYLGWDSHEDIAYQVARQSLLKHATIPVEVIPIKQYEMVAQDLYTRDIDPLAGVVVIDTHDLATLEHEITAQAPSLVIITTVTSELATLPDDVTRAAVDLAQRTGCVVLLDEAYGAQFRPVLLEGAPALSFGADLVVTNAD